MSDINDFIIEGGALKKYKGSGGDITVPGTVKEIAERAFAGSAISSLTAYTELTRIGKDAFKNCGALSFVCIGKEREQLSVSIGGEYEEAEICDYAFSGCTALETVEIGRSVKSIGRYAFKGCDSLKSITLPFIGAQKDGKGKGCFGYIFGASTSSDNRNKVPRSLRKVIVTEGAKKIGTSAFNGCEYITSVTLPSSIKKICGGAFRFCENLTEINVPIGVKNFPNCMFGYCFNLKSIIFQGTKEQWKKIKKSRGWDEYTGDYTVHCTDGDIK